MIAPTHGICKGEIRKNQQKKSVKLCLTLFSSYDKDYLLFYCLFLTIVAFKNLINKGCECCTNEWSYDKYPYILKW